MRSSLQKLNELRKRNDLSWSWRSEVRAKEETMGDEAHASQSDNDETSANTMKILFLSSDTGGGHRASAESLAKQFQLLWPGQVEYVLHDMVTNEGTPPYSSLVRFYKHLSANPSQWKLVYEVSNSRAFEMLADAHLKLMCERAVRRRIMDIAPDVVISVHPLMCNVPVMSCAKISQKTGKHLPMFTVVTDLGSAHCLWFANGVEKMFVGSQQVWDLAQARGKVPDEKLVMSGLPIRHDFAVQAEALGDRMSEQGKAYQAKVRQELELPRFDKPTLLVMGGGEGVGSLSKIVDALYVELVDQGIDALILVVCGRNEKLKDDLERRDWESVLEKGRKKRDQRVATSSTCVSTVPPTGCMDGTVTNSIRKILSNSSLHMDNPLSAPALQAEESPPAQEETALPPEKPTPAPEEPAPEEPAPEEPTPEEPTPEPAPEEQAPESAPAHLANTEGASFSEEKKELDFEAVSMEPQLPLVTQTPVSLDVPQPSFERCNGEVTVTGLGFVTRMAEYMVAADILVSKAGPGTISEAAAVSLPVMLTSFLPGQEEGNVDYVVDGGFGAYVSDKDPIGIAEELTLWLRDPVKLGLLSKAAKAKGAPHAARDIARFIGDSTLKWKEINEERSKENAEEVENISSSDSSQ
uniref:monogalactosyldiacylglycerol synthase n=1 Tax=Grammatophora oceanica TaxID=210454 RepID=A0A7S1Y4B8_9STRA|mmetsp:Transcript_27270/g.39950  ORF Transcript_27270/g.39950 Transcript_27270/m.39950 type:complete len:638 (+) Transcript_27270:130-2043(+)